MILVLGLGAVWQRTQFYETFRVGEVNRARRVIETASGKAANVARVATQLGMSARMISVAGGDRGKKFRRALRADGVAARLVPVRSETRICQTVIAGTITELVDEALPLRPAEVAAAVRLFEKELPRARLVVLTGAAPAGCPAGLYAQLTRLARRRGLPVVVDTQRAQLRHAAKAGPSLVKVNRQELLEAVGGSVRDVPAAAVRLMDRGVTRVVITDGPRAVRGYERVDGDRLRRYRVMPPKVATVNPIGSGDSLTVGMAIGLLRGDSLEDSMRLGVACGAANAMTELPGMVSPATVRKLRRLV